MIRAFVRQGQPDRFPERTASRGGVRLTHPALLLLLSTMLAGSALAVERNIQSYGAQCDGVANDAAAVQAAIDASNPGDVVIIPGPLLTGIADPGFTMDAKTNVTIRGVSGGGFKMLGDATRALNGNSHLMNVVQFSTNCVIENLIIDGNAKNACPLYVDHNDKLVVRNVTLNNVGFFTGSAGDSPAAALLATGNTGNRYENITIDTTAHFTGIGDGVRGLWIGNSWDTAYEWNPVITGCHVYNTGWTGIAGHPIGGHVYNNTVSGTRGGACIKQVPAPLSVAIQTTIVENNHCHDTTSIGLQFDFSHDLVVRNNLLERNTYAGIYFAPSIGHEAELTNGNLRNVITGNTIIDSGPTNNYSGIYLHGGSDVEISYNSIQDTRPPGTGMPISGIVFHSDYENYDQIRVFDNVLDGFPQNGLAILDGPAVYTNLDICNNVAKNNEWFGLYVQNSGSLGAGVQAYANTFSNNTLGTLHNLSEVSPPLSTVTLSFPVNGANVGSTSPTLTWNAVAGADTYHLAVSTDATFPLTAANRIYTGITGTSYGVTGLTAGTTYHWRVKAVKSDGDQSAWSSSRNFIADRRLLVAFEGGASVPGVSNVADEDVVAYSYATGTWSMLFDGSSVGLSSLAIDAFEVLDDGDFLLSFVNPGTVAGLIGGPSGTSVDDSDIVRFDSGLFYFHFDGSDVGLDSNDEDIDAISVHTDGRLMISTLGTVSATGASGEDEDLLIFNAVTLGSMTSGSFSMFFDGSDVGLTTTNEDVDAAEYTSTGRLLISTLGSFSVTGVSGNDEDILEFIPGLYGQVTSGTFSLYADLSALGISSSADVIAVSLVE